VNPAFPATLYVYNRNMFDAAGIPFPTPAWTFDDYRDLSVRLTQDRTGDGTPEIYGTSQPNTAWYWDWVGSNGGRIVDDTNSEFLLTENDATS